MKKSKLTVFDIALVGLMVAVIEVCKVALMGIANVELTTFWLILFSKHFGNKVYFVVPVFIALEGIIFGFGIWWVMYLYAWPLLILVTKLFKENNSALTWAIISGIFGLLFGLMCAIPYFFIGASGGFKSGISTAFAWWIAGIPFDLIHGIGNYVIMLLLYRPISKTLIGIQKYKAS